MPDEMDGLSPKETTRYSRHLILPEVGAEGQLNLKRGRALVVGAGGLGAPVLLYLAAAGVGAIGLIDDDKVDLSNLQRQVLYGQGDVGKSKAETAKQRLQEINPLITITAYNYRFSAENALQLISQYDVIIDGTDNFSTRYLVNDACVLAGKPNVHGAIYRFEGQVGVFSYDGGPCYRCLFPDPPPPDAVPNCAEGGVLGVMAGTIGMLQATEAIKLLLGKGSSLAGKLLVYDALQTQFETLTVRRDNNCPICGDNPKIKSVVEQAVVCSADRPVIPTVQVRDLHKELDAERAPFLLDVRSQEEFDLGHLSGAVHIPLPELVQRLSELNAAIPIVVYCKTGRRSQRAAEILVENGFLQVRNLEGGIAAWAMQVDSGLAVY
ncbi:MAG TPA: molybdopterin-synthase adenylyltransferase MoeB [Candidatus Obscuribacterales bacterium]